MSDCKVLAVLAACAEAIAHRAQGWIDAGNVSGRMRSPASAPYRFACRWVEEPAGHARLSIWPLVPLDRVQVAAVASRLRAVASERVVMLRADGVPVFTTCRLLPNRPTYASTDAAGNPTIVTRELAGIDSRRAFRDAVKEAAYDEGV